MDKQRRYDKSEVQFVNDNIDENGFLNVKIGATRPGVMPYKMTDGSLRHELKHPEDIFSDITINSTNSKAVTENHPREHVNIDNVKNYIKGMTHNDAKVEGGMITVHETIFDKDLIEKLMNGEKMEVSIGFDTEIVPEKGEYNGTQYDARQRNIEINHIAHVDKGRAGPEVGIRTDEDDVGWQEDGYKQEENEPANNKNYNEDGGVNNMDLKTIKLDEKEYQVASEVKERLDALQAKSDKVDYLEKENQRIQGELDTKKAENNNLQNKLDELENQEPDEQEIQKAIQERTKLVDTAKEFIEDFDPTDKKSYDIKIEVIKKLDEDFDPTEKSEEYIQARFDGAVEVLRKFNTKSVGDNSVKTNNSKSDNSKLEDKRNQRLNMKNSG